MHPGRVVAVRLPPELLERLRRLQAQFNLPPSSVLKLLIQSQLERPLTEQVELVTSIIIKNPSKASQKNRLHTNTRARPQMERGKDHE